MQDMNVKQPSPILSRIGLGTANFGNAYGYVLNPVLSHEAAPEREASAILSRAAVRGIRFLDTAHSYGKSEECIGQFLKTRSEEFFVVSKVSLDGFERQIRLSQERLAPHLQVILLHNFESSDASFEEAARLKKFLLGEAPGVELGCSTYGAEAAKKAVLCGLFQWVELEFNLLNRWTYDSVSYVARKKGVRLILRSLFQKGFLTSFAYVQNRPFHADPRLGSKLRSIHQEWSERAADLGVTLQRLAMGAVIARTTDEMLLLSANSPEQLDENISAYLELDPVFLEKALQCIPEGQSPLTPDEADLRKWLP